MKRIKTKYYTDPETGLKFSAKTFAFGGEFTLNDKDEYVKSLRDRVLNKIVETRDQLRDEGLAKVFNDIETATENHSGYLDTFTPKPEDYVTPYVFVAHFRAYIRIEEDVTGIPGYTPEGATINFVNTNNQPEERIEI